jgi:hypothetical protein
MDEKTYTYYISTDFPDGKICPTNLVEEIQACPDIKVALNRVDTEDNNAKVVFKAELSPDGKLALDGGSTQAEEHPPLPGSIIASHDPNPKQTPMPVELRDKSGNPIQTSEDNVLATVPQANTPGYRYHDRDIRLKTCLMDGDAAVEDLRVDTMHGQKRISWNEVELIAVLKGDDSIGYTPCISQADADANGKLSIFDFQMKNTSGTPVPYDILAGSFFVDPALIEPKDQHRGFIVAAANIPPLYGGSIPLMDCYLHPWEGKWVDSRSPHAMKLSPEASPEASKIRVYLYHPAGAKQTHILRFITFRPSGSW